MIIAVAEVTDPYERQPGETRPPLLAGLFVQAEIVGHSRDNVFEIPRDALRGREHVLLVDDEDRLRFRRVEVLRAERGRAVIRGGLQAGERVCLSPLETPVDGDRVRIVEAPDQTRSAP
jgi:multidrug efflux pump subunit AcrA (membrane-fusion protein)